MEFVVQDISNDRKMSYEKYISNFAIILLVTAIFHHFILCFINTHVVAVSSAWLVLTEVSLIGFAALLFIRSAHLTFILVLLFILANAFILSIFQQHFDPKAIRNFILPILLIWLGSQYDQKYPVDKFILHIGLIVLLIGLFELLFIDVFQKIFNVLDFLISTGRATESSTQYAETSFALNGTRYGGRNLLRFLGDHRVSSVFLETVTVSNFATVLAAWGLSKKNVKQILPIYSVGFLVAVLADSRFGVTLILLMTFLRVTTNQSLIRWFAYFMPLFVIFLCVYLGLEFTEFRDDFKTRLGYTGYFLINLSPLEFFGLSSHHYALFLDQGYVKLLHYSGLVLSLSLWISFCRLNVSDETALFKYFVAIIISTNLAISGDSIFSFKWASLMWFLIGVCLVPEQSIKKLRNN